MHVLIAISLLSGVAGMVLAGIIGEIKGIIRTSREIREEEWKAQRIQENRDYIIRGMRETKCK